MHAEIISRKDVPRLVKDRAAVGDFPRFMDDVRRAVLTPTQKLGCELLAEDTLLRGFYSVWYRRLEDLVLDAPGEPPRANLASNDLTPLFQQLEALRIIRAEWSQPDGWYVLVLPLCANWNVSWRCPASRRAQRWMHLDGLRRAAAPFLPAFAPDADLYDALARAGLDASSVADAPMVETAREGKSLASRQPFSSSQKVDAPVVLRAEERGAEAWRKQGHSESRNANLQGNGRVIPKVGMRTDSYAGAALSSGTISSKSALTLSVQELKDLIRSGSEDDFVKAMQAMIPTHERGDGGKWRAKWRRIKLKPFVVRMFEGIIEKIAEGTLQRAGALEAHFYWQDFGGARAEKDLEDSYLTNRNKVI